LRIHISVSFSSLQCFVPNFVHVQVGGISALLNLNF
jgi:hypothetical protein